MKRFLLIIFALCIMLLCGCQAANNDVITPASPVDPPSDIYIGMPWDELMELYPSLEEGGICYYQYLDYAFFEDRNGNPVVVHLIQKNKNFIVESVCAYDKNGVNKLDEMFRSLEGGMTVQEIVSFVGLPEPITLASNALIYDLDGGIRYLISLTPSVRYDDASNLALCEIVRWKDGVPEYIHGTEPWYPPESTKP